LDSETRWAGQIITERRRRFTGGRLETDPEVHTEAKLRTSGPDLVGIQSGTVKPLWNSAIHLPAL
jgi:hypothetical protein